MDNLRNQVRLIEKDVKGFIGKAIWPMQNSVVNMRVRSFIFNLQKVIAELSKQNKKSLVFKLMDVFAFNLIIRLYVIQEIKTKPFWFTLGYIGFKLKKATDCLVLLEQTKWTLINKQYNKLKPWIRQRRPNQKKNKLVYKMGILKFKDLVLQKILVLLIEPYYESFLHNEVFGFRRGRSQIHAVAELISRITQDQVDKTILLLDIQKGFPQILSNKLKQISVPLKFRNLINNWLHWDLFKIKSFIRTFDTGIFQYRNIIGPLFLNILLNGLKEAAFLGLPKNLNRNFSSVDIVNHCITFADNIALVFNVSFLNNVIFNIKRFLGSIGLELNKEKTRILRLKKKKIYFDYLGFRIYYISVPKLRLGSLIQNYKILHKKEIKEPGKILVTISPISFINIKKYIKSVIKLSYNFSVSQLIDKLNFIIRGFGNYFNWSQSYCFLRCLDSFIFKRVFVFLTRKFKRLSKETIVTRYFPKIDGRKWVLVGNYSNFKNKNAFRKGNIVVLRKCVELKTISIMKGRLSYKLKALNYFMFSNLFVMAKSKVWQLRKASKLYL